MKNCLALFLLLLLNFSVTAQDFKSLNTKDLKATYFNHLSFLMNKKEILEKGYKFTLPEVKSIITLRQNKYVLITQIADSISRKRLMLEEVEDLVNLKQNFGDSAFVKNYVQANLTDVELYKRNTDSLKLVSGLESCTKCAISRNVKIVVLKVKNNKIDTINCVSAKYMKIGFMNIPLSTIPFESYPCYKLLKNLSLTGAYSKSIIEIYYKDSSQKLIKLTKEFALIAGKSENDILTVPIIINE